MPKRSVHYALAFAAVAIANTILTRLRHGGDWWLDADFVVLMAALGALYGWRTTRSPKD